MNVKLLVRFSALALVLIAVGISGCSEGSDRIFTPQAEEPTDQLSTGIPTEYVDGNPGNRDDYSMFDDGTDSDQFDYYDGWLEKYGQDTDGGSQGGTSKPRDSRPRSN